MPIALAVAPLLLVLAAVTWRHARGRALRAVAGLVFVSGLLSFARGGYEYWFTHRPQPAPVEERLFTGVTYSRLIFHEPRPLVVHVARIDLTAPGVDFLVTPPEPTAGRRLRARTVSEFVRDYHVQLAVNGSFFEPWRSNSLFDYYPHSGDGVDAAGLAVSRGVPYAVEQAIYPPLYFGRDRRPAFDPPPGGPENALAGNCRFLVQSVVPALAGCPHGYEFLHPRTAAGLDAGRRTLFLIVVDGRQPNYSEGVTLYELAAIARDLGASDALNLDGGGSSALVIEGPDGRPQVLNSPIDNNLPGRERPVANHLGVFARRP